MCSVINWGNNHSEIKKSHTTIGELRKRSYDSGKRSYENRGNHAFFPRTGKGADKVEILEHFLAQFYGNKVPAKQVLISQALPNKNLFQDGTMSILLKKTGQYQ